MIILVSGPTTWKRLNLQGVGFIDFPIRRISFMK